jgi:translation elongation factor EF-1beta
MEVKLQLKTASGTVAASLGYESQVDDAVKELGLRMYPINPGTQDSKEATMFYIPVADQETADRAVEALREHEGVESVGVRG